MPEPSRADQGAMSPRPAGRDPRLDVFRGIALVMIFINHVPGTVFERFTSRNFGFSDAAEGFVLMSGIAAGLAYSSGLRHRPFWPGIARIWARARQLYFMHIVTSVLALGIFAIAARFFGLYELLLTINIAPAIRDPLGAVIGLGTLGHQLGYFNILPLYAALLLVTPAMILIGLRQPLVLLALAILGWVLAGQFRINVPAYPNPGGWFFNPFSWQLIFVLGLIGGLAMKSGRSFYPKSRLLFWLSAFILLFVLVWMKVPPVGRAAGATLGWLRDLGVPFYLVSFDKTFLSLPRLLHALALAYVLVSLPVVLQFARSRFVEPLALIGRNGLAVFATGSVLSILIQAIRAGVETGIAGDGLLLLAGLGIQVLLALSLEATRRSTEQKRQRQATLQ
ncbi:OpgC domain-containing protein [Arsenicitalea aurantiaca]|uniref:OpgC domain-containing protein n=1 Tax=Arsenicitalea aurantiaca TaxID=1783274 RepID=A0A433XB12_9HYPH|nr:OpgC domain-containing protein [Arsenicitalea aurantiaca]RUT31265.1 OpgC domain-containing protein [Arsenicitalea aurantiaca]